MASASQPADGYRNKWRSADKSFRRGKAEIPITFFCDAVKAPDTRRDPADDKSSALPSGRAPAPSIPGSRRALTLLCLVLDHFNDHRLLLETGKALYLLAVL